jgi:hypothetical protein
MFRSVAWMTLVGLMTAYFAILGTIEPTLRKEGRVAQVNERSIVLIDERGSEDARVIGSGVKISLNNRDVNVDELFEGDHVALLSDTRGGIKEIIAVRNHK